MTGIFAAALLAGMLAGPEGGTISGRVVDHEGNPAPGARVWAVWWINVIGETVADEQGRFRLGPIEEDHAVDLWAEAPGLARGRREGVVVFGGIDREIDPLPLLPGTRMTGRAVDAQGRPIGGAGISISLNRFVRGYTVTSNQGEWTIEADAEGRFITPPLPAGLAGLLIDAPGKVRTHVGKHLEPGVPGIDLGDVALPDETPIRGVVVDQDGEPAPGVKIRVDYDHNKSAISDAEGRFVVTGAGEDAEQLIVQADAYFSPDPIELGPARGDLKITVTRAFLIEGAAVDAETGEPVAVGTATLCTVERHPDGTYSLYG